MKYKEPVVHCFGLVLQELRKQKGLSKDAVAAALEVPFFAYVPMEAGQDLPSGIYLFRIITLYPELDLCRTAGMVLILQAMGKEWRSGDTSTVRTLIQTIKDRDLSMMQTIEDIFVEGCSRMRNDHRSSEIKSWLRDDGYVDRLLGCLVRVPSLPVAAGFLPRSVGVEQEQELDRTSVG